MYDIPDRDDVDEVVITAEVVLGEAEPKMILDSEKKETA
jgi:ATP-dependent Clp protease ATP-binding subunit ClpX